MNPKAKGEISEAVILSRMLQKGYSVSIPFGNNQRYDLIIDTGTALIRAQCKTACSVNGCVSFRTVNTNGFTGKSRGYVGQADVFLVFHPETDSVYWIPVEKVGQSEVRLRLLPARGGSKSNIRWAKDYQI